MRAVLRFEECVERLQGEHVHLVDDVDAVAAYLRRDAHLIDQVADVVHRVVRRGVELVDVERAVFVEGFARFAFVARFGICGRVEAVDRFGEDTRAGGLAHAARSAEEVGVCQLTAADRVF